MGDYVDAEGRITLPHLRLALQKELEVLLRVGEAKVRDGRRRREIDKIHCNQRKKTTLRRPRFEF